MEVVFYISAGVALLASAMVISRLNAMHAALYLVVSLLAVALVFFSLGAPFVGALEIIVYAGAIMVLVVFVIMLLNLGSADTRRESLWLRPSAWLGPGLLAMVLLAQLVVILSREHGESIGMGSVGAKQVALGLYGPYLIGVELASMLLMAGLVGAYHLGVGRAPGRPRIIERSDSNKERGPMEAP